MTSLVHVVHASKTYRQGETPALVDASIEVDENDRIALVGRSGSGKSTLLNLMAGLDHPSEGLVTWHGSAQLPLPGLIGSAFQSPSLIPWLDVEENVCLPLLFSKVARPADPLTLLAQLGVAELARKLPGELSGGQAQRVALARAMVTIPVLLLADEPSGQLDHETAGSVLATLENWADEHNVALVIATHDPEIAAAMKRVVTLEHGRMTEIPQ
jgi:putative ABC transport system ATP-binding protein